MVASLMSALPGSVAQGLIWGILAIGVYITYKVLDFADLTVDGSLATGGARCGYVYVKWSKYLCGIDSCVSCRYVSRTCDGTVSYGTGNPTDLSGNPDTAWTLLHQYEDYGKGKSGDQRYAV